jgi:hypothetical protein
LVGWRGACHACMRVAPSAAAWEQWPRDHRMRARPGGACGEREAGVWPHGTAGGAYVPFASDFRHGRRTLRSGRAAQPEISETKRGCCATAPASILGAAPACYFGRVAHSSAGWATDRGCGDGEIQHLSRLAAWRWAWPLRLLTPSAAGGRAGWIRWTAGGGWVACAAHVCRSCCRSSLVPYGVFGCGGNNGGMEQRAAQHKGMGSREEASVKRRGGGSGARALA